MSVLHALARRSIASAYPTVWLCTGLFEQRPPIVSSITKVLAFMSDSARGLFAEFNGAIDLADLLSHERRAIVDLALGPLASRTIARGE